MPDNERFALTVVDGLSIERAALLALLADALPHVPAVDPASADGSRRADTSRSSTSTGSLPRG